MQMPTQTPHGTPAPLTPLTPPRRTTAARIGVALALLLVLAAMLLAGCMGGDDGADTNPVSETDTTDPAPTTTVAAIPPSVATGEATVVSTATEEATPTPAPPTPTATPVDTRVLTLQDALLTLDDLPSGYFVRRSTDGDSPPTSTEQGQSAAICDVALAGPLAEVSVERIWERTVNGPFVRQELLWLPDADDAASEWLRVRRAAARACDDWVAADGSSSQITILRTPVFSSGAPRESLAVRIVTDAGTGDHPIDLVSIIVVTNHVASVTTLIDLGADVDQDLALSVAEAAFARISQIAGDSQP